MYCLTAPSLGEGVLEVSTPSVPEACVCPGSELSRGVRKMLVCPAGPGVSVALGSAVRVSSFHVCQSFAFRPQGSNPGDAPVDFLYGAIL